MAKKKYYIIDGYNLIYVWSELKEDDFAAAREKLINILIEYGAYEEMNIILVFDAGATLEPEHSDVYSERFEVIYTGYGQTADNVIERLVYEMNKKRLEVHVVSSDAVIETVILGAGAYRHPSREFYRLIKHFKKKLRDKYLSNVKLPLVRSEVADRIDPNVFIKLERLRRLK